MAAEFLSDTPVVVSVVDLSVAAHLGELNGGLWDRHGQGLAELWLMVLVWILVADPIIRAMLLVSTLTVCAQVGILSLLETKAVCENAEWFCAFVFSRKTKKHGNVWLPKLILRLVSNSPVRHCPSQHAGETVCQMRNWHHQQCNTTGSRVTTGTIKSGWLRDVCSTDLVFDRGDERTVGCILGQSTTRLFDWNSTMTQNLFIRQYWKNGK